MIFKGQFKWQKLKIYKYIQSNSPLFLPVFLTLSFTLSLSFIFPLFRAQMKTLCLSGSKENLSDFFSLNSFGTESSLWKSSWGSFTDPHWTVLSLLAVLPSPPPNVHRSSRLGGRKGVIFRVCRTGGWEFLRVRRREPQAALWGPWELCVSCFYLQPWPPRACHSSPSAKTCRVRINPSAGTSLWASGEEATFRGRGGRFNPWWGN